jgi:hypothetical protein
MLHVEGVQKGSVITAASGVDRRGGVVDARAFTWRRRGAASALATAPQASFVYNEILSIRANKVEAKISDQESTCVQCWRHPREIRVLKV